MAQENGIEQLLAEHAQWYGIERNFGRLEYRPDVRQHISQAAYGDPSVLVDKGSDTVYAHVASKLGAIQEKIEASGNEAAKKYLEFLAVASLREKPAAAKRGFVAERVSEFLKDSDFANAVEYAMQSDAYVNSYYNTMLSLRHQALPENIRKVAAQAAFAEA